VSELMLAIMELAERLGVSKINELPGCWEHRVDEHWWIALNGHREETLCENGTSVPPFHAYIEFNDWPAGLVGLNGGAIAAGTIANEDSLLAALRDAAVALEPEDA
jgi:hypothetical protein